MTGTFIGNQAILSLYKDEFIPYVCATQMSVSLDAEEIDVATAGRGVWSNSTTGLLSYTISLSGVLQTDDNGFTNWDFIYNWFGKTSVRFRIAFEDSLGNIKSLEGYTVSLNNTLSPELYDPIGTTVTLKGTGELKIYDGLVPCESEITSITVTERNDGTGDIDVLYDYTGMPYQVKFRVDSLGNYAYAVLGQSIVIKGAAIGAHSIEIVPVCYNTYEGLGLVQTYNITHNLVCLSVMTDITISGDMLSATPVYTGTPTQYQAIIDSTSKGIFPIGLPTPIGLLSVGVHTITMIPMCGGPGIPGTGFTKSFTVTSQPAQSVINWDFAGSLPSSGFSILVDGNTRASAYSNASGTLTVFVGQQVIGRVGITGVGAVALTTLDSTLGTTLDHSTATHGNLSYTILHANGDTYSISGSTP